MKTNFLFPHRLKKLGWFLFVPTLLLGLYTVITDFEPSFLTREVLAFNIDEFSNEHFYFHTVKNNLLNEILGVLMIISAVLVAFSKEAFEDEFIAHIRLESLVWATYVNYAVLLFSFLLVYDFSFLWIMIFNMFTILFFFIARFNWQLSRLSNRQAYEK